MARMHELGSASPPYERCFTNANSRGRFPGYIINIFIIYLQKIPLDTTYFPTQKHKIPYHATNVIFSVSLSYIFYPPPKTPAPDSGF